MKLLDFFKIIVLLNALGSVTLIGIPIQWIGALLAMVIGCILLYDFLFVAQALPRKIYIILFLFSAFFLWTTALNLTQYSNYAGAMPSLATTSYPIFISLRYFSFFSFIGCVILIIKINQLGGMNKAVKLLVNIGTIIACYAIYVYLAQTFGLPELLPRNRLGTGGGGPQSTTFTYAFHRAMGSFREPSHLAEWLMVPFALSFIQKPKLLEPRKILIGITILLTGSMTGILSLFMGFITSFILVYLSSIYISVPKKNIVRFIFGVLLFLMLVSIVNISLSGLLINTIQSRTFEILEGGMLQSNRGHVYEYIQSIKFPWIGVGLGNQNLAFSTTTNNPAVTSFLSFYFNILYNAGLGGFIIVVCILLFPLKILLHRRRSMTQQYTLFCVLWGYIAWLIALSVGSEELSLMFGVIYGFLISMGSVKPSNLKFSY